MRLCVCVCLCFCVTLFVGVCSFLEVFVCSSVFECLCVYLNVLFVFLCV